MSWYSDIKIWARSLDAKWNDARSAGVNFSDFATQMLSGHEFHKNFSLKNVVKEILEEKNYPDQVHPQSAFGEPPITLYFSQDKSFYLDMYVWSSAHTSIHQHFFEGAFTVLEGISIETDYEFLSKQNFGPSKLGKLHKKAIRKLVPGDLRTIHYQEKMVHRVLHLSEPTVSLVLRTLRPDKTDIQYNYDFETLASDGHPPGNVIGKLRVLEWYLKQGQVPGFQMVQDLLPYANFWMTLGKYPLAHPLLQKLAFLHCGTDLLNGLLHQTLFLNIYAELHSEEDKALFTAWEYDPHNWQKWIEDHFHIPRAEALERLQAMLLKSKWVDEASKKSPLLKQLF